MQTHKAADAAASRTCTLRILLVLLLKGTGLTTTLQKPDLHQ
jgi:hypothetical protein